MPTVQELKAEIDELHQRIEYIDKVLTIRRDEVSVLKTSIAKLNSDRNDLVVELNAKLKALDDPSRTGTG